MNQKQRTTAALIALFLVAGGAYAFLEWQANPSSVQVADGTATTTPGAPATTTEEKPAEPEPVPATSSTHAYGTVTLRLNETASFPDGLSMRVAAVTEDSRCPQDVHCIQAGTVRISLRTRSAMGASTSDLALGASVTTEAERITFLRVAPGKNSTQPITDADYRFTFEVAKKDAPPAPVAGPCFVGGCSAQLCSDTPSMASTCEYRSEYACYRNATCERQASGQCGWTETSELRACLRNPPEDEE
ncbi:MAG TPA: hypothetical protein VGB97_02190 [Candidatus Paceibacterota bacterium]|jgi:hypothetical protein